MPDNSNGRGKRLRSVRKPGGNFDLYEAKHLDLPFADGWSSVRISPTVSKISFYQVFGSESDEGNSEESVELRDYFLALTMPTVAWVRLAERILKMTKESADELSESSAEGIKYITNIAKKLED